MALSHESLLNMSQQTEVKWLIVQNILSTRMALRAPEARASFALCSVWAWEAEERDIQLR